MKQAIPQLIYLVCYRLGGERYKSKVRNLNIGSEPLRCRPHATPSPNPAVMYSAPQVVYETLNPRWAEQFELYLYEETELEITVWDRDQRSKDDFMGR